MFCDFPHSGALGQFGIVQQLFLNGMHGPILSGKGAWFLSNEVTKNFAVSGTVA
jgi:hypothetical protein